ncbi:MAG: NHLP family bacteriocin export ABC transporter peptidase/permease/ATPase subunit [Treponema sp.]|nr:NHLP family bacteriocin export ABC transporter peptidase/permease/ATPase subunit [Treponema sp.]
MSDHAEKAKPQFEYTHKRVRSPTILQMEAVECGAASLAMILGYHGSFIPLEQLRVECGVSRDGSKASKMLQAARKFGLEAKGYRYELSDLAKVEFPAIIFWNFNHFVVLDGFSKNKAYINDPADGRRVISYEEFDSSFTGVVLCFKKTENFVKQGKKPSIIPLLKKRTVGMKDVLSYVILVGLFLLVPGFIIPSFSRFFVDNILVGGMKGFLKPLLFAMAFTALLQGCLTAIQQNYLRRFHIKLALSSSARFLDHVFKMPVEFFTQRMPGEICNRIQTNDSVATLISTKLTGAVVNLICVIFYAAIMFSYDVPLTLLCIIVVACNFTLLKVTAETIKTFSFKSQMELGKLYGQTMSGIEMIETLKASGLENDFFQEWAGQHAKVVLQNQKLSKVSQAITQIPQFLSKLLNLAVLAVGALRVMHGDLTMGMLVAFQSLQSSFIGPVNEFLQMGNEMQSGQADMQRLDDVMNYPVEKRYKDDYEQKQADAVQEESAASQKIEKLQGYISLKNVTFGYSRLAPPLITDLNLELKPGTRVALVGGSGSGKSTIGKLVSSLYKPWSGELLYDGKPLSEINRMQFTNSVAVVDQDIFLFEGTVRENLTMWDTSIPESVFVQAAKDACIHDVIAVRPGGYYSKVDEFGKNFSGGQRQRLEIARALSLNPRILIMDEATSALDPVTEQIVDENIRRRGCTCIVIAHRLSTIRDSDEILVLDKGQIVQRGTHDELMAAGGLYSDLIKTM